jgi:hypothetical protein
MSDVAARPDGGPQIPVDLGQELHIKVPDAAGMTFRQILGRIEGLGRPVA